MTELASHTKPEATLPPQLRALEAALRLLHATGDALGAIPATQLDLRGAARALERAVGATLDAYDLRRDPLAASRDALSAIDEARPVVRQAEGRIEGLEPIVTWLDRAHGWLLVAEDHYARFPAAGAPARALVVAGQVPELFRIDRTSITPRYRVADPLAPPPPPPEPVDASLPPAARVALVKERAERARSEARERQSARARAREARRLASEEPEVEPLPGFVKGSFAALSPEAFIEKRARELFEEVALCGVQRKPLLGDAWRDADTIDRRMLRAVDAFVGLGPVAIAALERLAIDTPAKDPSRGFALAFIAGCIEGRDGLAAVERVVRHLDPADPEVAELVGGALKLVPHPGLEPMLRAWLSDEDPAFGPIAIDVLGYRGLANEADFTAAFARSDAAMLVPALRWAALGPMEHRMLARGVVEALRETRDPKLAQAIAWAFVLGGLGAGVDEVARWLGGPNEAAVLLPMAVSGEREHALALVELVGRAPTEENLLALGFAGPAEALPVLVATLSKREVSPEAKLAAAFALQRITGYEPFEDVDLPPEKLDVEGPADPPGLPDDKPRLAKQLSDARDRPDDGAPDRMRLPSTRPHVWEAYLRQEGARYAKERRHRRGRPYTAAIVFEELDGYAVTPAERRLLHAELVVQTGEHLRFDPHDFVAVQEASLRAWAPIAHRASSQPGAYTRGRRR